MGFLYVRGVVVDDFRLYLVVRFYYKVILCVGKVFCDMFLMDMIRLYDW